MFRVLRSGRDPLAQQPLLFGSERQVRFHRRHPHRFVVARDPRDQFARRGIAGDDRRLNRPVARVEPQLRLATFRVGAMAEEALVGEDRTNVAVEVRLGRERMRTHQPEDRPDRRNRDDHERSTRRENE